MFDRRHHDSKLRLHDPLSRTVREIRRAGAGRSLRDCRHGTPPESGILSADCSSGSGLIDSISILGSGWLGRPLAERFAAHGCRVRTSTRSADRLQALAAIPSEPCLVDIGDIADEIDAFLDSETLIVNITSKDIDGFRGLVEKIEDSKIESVLFVSSTSVYPLDSGRVSEADGAESPDHPLIVIENLFRQSRRFRTTVVRFAGLIGPGRHPGRFFRGNKTVRNADACVNLIHLDDCVDIIERIVTGGVWGETFNASADTHPSKREFYTRAASLAGVAPPPFEDGDGSFKLIDNGKLKKVLGYRFHHPDLMTIRFDESA
jgi:nucleoside-diphosphate-sugar epimerase